MSCAAEHALTLAGQCTEGKVAIQFAADNDLNKLAQLQETTQSVTTVCLSPPCVGHCMSVADHTMHELKLAI